MRLPACFFGKWEKAGRQAGSYALMIWDVRFDGGPLSKTRIFFPANSRSIDRSKSPSRYPFRAAWSAKARGAKLFAILLCETRRPSKVIVSRRLITRLIHRGLDFGLADVA
jgi:hypothetical protein